ncbi:Conidiation protein 6-domain-containing protein [Coprinopsis sp. MPI-PUGE-AT-0042]|nr:Conidiation protein 6-domain-containing protein [Coprinopsis sp. MPI-PUGE-AT-0042]
MSSDKNTGNVIGGLKAAINNPRVSEEAKEHDRERLREMGEEVEGTTTSSSTTTRSRTDHSSTGDQEHENRVLGGYKATLKNPNVSEEAKEHAKDVLEEAGEKV